MTLHQAPARVTMTLILLATIGSLGACSRTPATHPGEEPVSEDMSLRFESRLRAPRQQIWEWITSIEGISKELWPWLRMTTPKGMKSLNDIDARPGEPLFRTRIYLFGFLPIDHSDLTLLQLDAGGGFLEESPTGSMELWRHERRILPDGDNPDTLLLVDQLTFRPRRMKRLTRWFIQRVFTHRHAVLRRNLGGVE